MISSDMEGDGHVDRIIVMCEGQISGIMRRENILKKYLIFCRGEKMNTKKKSLIGLSYLSLRCCFIFALLYWQVRLPFLPL